MKERCSDFNSIVEIWVGPTNIVMAYRSSLLFVQEVAVCRPNTSLLLDSADDTVDDRNPVLRNILSFSVGSLVMQDLNHEQFFRGFALGACSSAC